MLSTGVRWYVVPIVVMSLGVGCAAVAGAQTSVPSTEPSSGSTTASTSVPTNEPSGESTDVSTTVPTSVPTSEPTAEAQSRGSYAGQPLFDPASNLAVPELVASARRSLADAERLWEVARTAANDAQAEADDLQRRLGLIEVSRAEQVEGVATSKRLLRGRLISAFIRGDESGVLLSVMAEPLDLSRAKRYLQASADLDLEALERYEQGLAELTRTEQRLVDERAAIEARSAQARADVDATAALVADAQLCVRAMESGSRVCAPGFTFPVLGEVNFINSWGFARLPGTASQHWHEGVDIMAPIGREIVAVESGTVYKVGTAGLGGLRLWLAGDSGAHYYYAHFSSIRPEVVDGLRVTPGTLLGYNGDTGGASGGPPHLHFEIHPGNIGPVNPYFVLLAAWGDRPMPLESEALAGPVSATFAVPAEEQSAEEQ